MDLKSYKYYNSKLKSNKKTSNPFLIMDPWNFYQKFYITLSHRRSKIKVEHFPSFIPDDQFEVLDVTLLQAGVFVIYQHWSNDLPIVVPLFFFDHRQYPRIREDCYNWLGNNPQAFIQLGKDMQLEVDQSMVLAGIKNDPDQVTIHKDFIKKPSFEISL